MEINKFKISVLAASVLMGLTLSPLAQADGEAAAEGSEIVVSEGSPSLTSPVGEGEHGGGSDGLEEDLSASVAETHEGDGEPGGLDSGAGALPIEGALEALSGGGEESLAPSGSEGGPGGDVDDSEHSPPSAGTEDSSGKNSKKEGTESSLSNGSKGAGELIPGGSASPNKESENPESDSDKDTPLSGSSNSSNPGNSANPGTLGSPSAPLTKEQIKVQEKELQKNLESSLASVFGSPTIITTQNNTTETGKTGNTESKSGKPASGSAQGSSTSSGSTSQSSTATSGTKTDASKQKKSGLIATFETQQAKFSDYLSKATETLPEYTDKENKKIAENQATAALTVAQTGLNTIQSVLGTSKTNDGLLQQTYGKSLDNLAKSGIALLNPYAATATTAFQIQHADDYGTAGADGAKPATLYKQYLDARTTLSGDTGLKALQTALNAAAGEKDKSEGKKTSTLNKNKINFYKGWIDVLAQRDYYQKELTYIKTQYDAKTSALIALINGNANAPKEVMDALKKLNTEPSEENANKLASAVTNATEYKADSHEKALAADISTLSGFYNNAQGDGTTKLIDHSKDAKIGATDAPGKYGVANPASVSDLAEKDTPPAPATLADAISGLKSAIAAQVALAQVTPNADGTAAEKALKTWNDQVATFNTAKDKYETAVGKINTAVTLLNAQNGIVASKQAAKDAATAALSKAEAAYNSKLDKDTKTAKDEWGKVKGSSTGDTTRDQFDDAYKTYRNAVSGVRTIASQTVSLANQAFQSAGTDKTADDVTALITAKQSVAAPDVKAAAQLLADSHLKNQLASIDVANDKLAVAATAQTFNTALAAFNDAYNGLTDGAKKTLAGTPDKNTGKVTSGDYKAVSVDSFAGDDYATKLAAKVNYDEALTNLLLAAGYDPTKIETVQNVNGEDPTKNAIDLFRAVPPAAGVVASAKPATTYTSGLVTSFTGYENTATAAELPAVKDYKSAKEKLTANSDNDRQALGKAVTNLSDVLTATATVPAAPAAAAPAAPGAAAATPAAPAAATGAVVDADLVNAYKEAINALGGDALTYGQPNSADDFAAIGMLVAGTPASEDGKTPAQTASQVQQKYLADLGLNGNQLYLGNLSLISDSDGKNELQAGIDEITGETRYAHVIMEKDPAGQYHVKTHFASTDLYTGSSAAPFTDTVLNVEAPFIPDTLLTANGKISDASTLTIGDAAPAGGKDMAVWAATTSSAIDISHGLYTKTHPLTVINADGSVSQDMTKPVVRGADQIVLQNMDIHNVLTQQQVDAQNAAAAKLAAQAAAEGATPAQKTAASNAQKVASMLTSNLQNSQGGTVVGLSISGNTNDRFIDASGMFTGVAPKATPKDADDALIKLQNVNISVESGNGDATAIALGGDNNHLVIAGNGNSINAVSDSDIRTAAAIELTGQNNQVDISGQNITGDIRDNRLTGSNGSNANKVALTGSSAGNTWTGDAYSRHTYGGNNGLALTLKDYNWTGGSSASPDVTFNGGVTWNVKSVTYPLYRAVRNKSLGTRSPSVNSLTLNGVNTLNLVYHQKNGYYSLSHKHIYNLPVTLMVEHDLNAGKGALTHVIIGAYNDTNLQSVGGAGTADGYNFGRLYVADGLINGQPADSKTPNVAQFSLSMPGSGAEPGKVDIKDETLISTNLKQPREFVIYKTADKRPLTVTAADGTTTTQQTTFVSMADFSQSPVLEAGIYQYRPQAVADPKTNYTSVYYVSNGHLSNSAATVAALAAAPASIASQEADALASHVSSIRHSNTSGVWLSYYGGKNENRLKNSTQYDLQTNGVMIGLDTTLADKWLAGVAFNSGKSSLNVMQSHGDINSYGAQFYMSRHYDNGMFVDGSAQFDHFSNKARARVLNGGQPGNADYATNGYGLGVKVGYTWTQASGFYAEPYLRAIGHAFSGSAYNLHNGMHVYSADYKSMIGEVGADLGYTASTGNGYVKPYLHLAVLDEFANGNSVNVNAYNIDNNINGAAFQVGIGAEAKFMANFGGYAGIGYTTGGDIKRPWQATIGINYTW